MFNIQIIAKLKRYKNVYKKELQNQKNTKKEKNEKK